MFCSPDGVNYMALICFLNGSLAREAVRDQYDMTWDGFSQALRDTPPGNGGALMLPYFAAEIVPHIRQAGVVRRDLDPADAVANVRAVVEAQALSSRLHSAWMEVPVTSLSVTGGASNSAAILQVYADVHDCPVHRFQTPNSAGLGAALRACHGHRNASSPDRATGWATGWPPNSIGMRSPFVRSDPRLSNIHRIPSLGPHASLSFCHLSR